MIEKCKSEFRQKLSSPKIRQWQSIYKIFLFQLYSRKIVSVGWQLYIINIWLIHNTKESMLWNYKTFQFSPKMRQMMYPDCKTTLLELLIKTTNCTFWSITHDMHEPFWPTKILMPFLSFSDILLLDACITFQSSVDDFKIMHKTC